MDKIDKDVVHDADCFPPLSGPFAGMRKYRVGDYRVIFVIIDDCVLILRIQDRKDVYRKDGSANSRELSSPRSRE
jgi:mRNA interferase RelE/StbE